jgi:hypothetical protein
VAAGTRSLHREVVRLTFLAEVFGASTTADAIGEVMRSGHVGAEYVLRHRRGLTPAAPPLKLGRPEPDTRVKGAHFPEVNTIDDFDLARRKLKGRYLALHGLDFLKTGVNPLFIGTPGTGKMFLARALAYKACLDNRRVVVVSAPRMLNELHGAEVHGRLEKALLRYVRAELLVIDDFVVLAMDAAQAKLAFQVISERWPPLPASAPRLRPWPPPAGPASTSATAAPATRPPPSTRPSRSCPATPSSDAPPAP